MRDLSRDLRWMSLNTGTVRKQGTLPDIVDAAARHGFRAIQPWRDEVKAAGIEASARKIRDAGLAVTGYVRAGWYASDASRKQEVRDDNRRILDEAKAIGSDHVTVVGGGFPQFARPGSAPSKDIKAAWAQIEDGIAETLDYARQVKIRLAIEPLHPMVAPDRALINTLKHALDLCDKLDPKNDGVLGVAVDTYHVWWDPELPAQIKRAGKRIFSFHVNDWLVPTTDTLNDRGMMGDGIIDIPRIRGDVEAAGYDSYVEVEIFSHRWWAEPMDNVLGTCMERMKTVC